jgi:adenosylcobinamide-GDP ribazoletransferase
LMTALPIRGVVWDRPNPGIAAWFPAVGLLYGAAGYVLVKLASLAHVQTRAPYVVATVVLIVWALMSRMMHWDAVADVGDAYWGSEDPGRRLEILSDSSTGAFGTTAVMLVALLEVSSIALIIAWPHEFVMLVVPVLSRFAATMAAWLGTPARAGGLGRTVMGHPRMGSIAIAVGTVTLAVAGLAIAYRPGGAIPALVGLAAAFGVPFVLARRFGGVTGDVMGASVLATEAVTFATFVLALGWMR